MAAFHKALHMQRVVIVTPSVYGTDNSSTLYAHAGARCRRARCGGDRREDRRARRHGTGRRAWHPAESPPAASTTRRLAVNGCRRANVKSRQLAYPAEHQPGDDRCYDGPRGHRTVPIVFDHFGGAKAELGPQQPRQAGRASPIGQGVCQNLSGLSRLHPHRLCRALCRWPRR